jgi:hypothetical protein
MKRKKVRRTETNIQNKEQKKAGVKGGWNKKGTEMVKKRFPRA